MPIEASGQRRTRSKQHAVSVHNALGREKMEATLGQFEAGSVFARNGIHVYAVEDLASHRERGQTWGTGHCGMRHRLENETRVAVLLCGGKVQVWRQMLEEMGYVVG